MSFDKTYGPSPNGILRPSFLFIGGVLFEFLFFRIPFEGKRLVDVFFPHIFPEDVLWGVPFLLSIPITTGFYILGLRFGGYKRFKVEIRDRSIEGPKNYPSDKGLYRQIMNITNKRIARKPLNKGQRAQIECRDIDWDKSFKKSIFSSTVGSFGTFQIICSKTSEDQILLHWCLGDRQIEEIKRLCEQKSYA